MNRWSDKGVAALSQADLLFLAAGLLEAPRRAEPFTPPAGRSEIVALARGAGLPDDVTQALGETLRHARTTPPARWRREYTRLFEAHGSCPPNETAYIRRDKGAVLADLCGFYRAFGCDPAGSSGEKADHIVTELQFAALLLVLRARADGEGESEARDTCGRALTSFAVDHLGEWLPSFATRLAEASGEPLFPALAAYLTGLWSFICDDNGCEIPERDRYLIPIDRGDTPYECGLAPAGDNTQRPDTETSR